MTSKHSLQKNLSLAALLATANVALFAAANVAVAQDEDAIVVTGSRIRVDPLTQTQPIIQLGPDEIARSGLSATADVLQRLPISGGGLNTKSNNSGNIGAQPDGSGVGAGAAEVDLRFLGGRRVLVLVDGLRWVNGTAGSGVPGSVDLNTIPASMIQRIEVLQEGASPIYGSDAIAGVVNIVTKQREEGLSLSAQAGSYYEEGDGFTQNYSATFGLRGGSNNIVVGADYQNQERVFSGDRPLSAFPAPYASSCLSGCSGIPPTGRYILTFSGQDLDLVTGNVGATPRFDPSNPHVVSATNTLRDRAAAPADRYNFAPQNYIQTPSERLGVFSSFTHDFSDDLTFRLVATYENRHSTNQAAEVPLQIGPGAGTGTIADNTVVDVTNPFNPFGFTLQPGTYDAILRRMVESGPRHFEQDVDTFTVRASLDGAFSGIGGKDWYWDVNYVYGKNEAAQSFTGNINVGNLQRALGPVSLCTGDCVPVNLFGGPGTITQAMLNYIGYTEDNSSDQILHDFTANLTGDLFDLPAGPLAFAVGYEYRKNEGSFVPDPVTQAGLSADIPAAGFNGEFDVNEVYAELKIPLIADTPFFYSLEGSIAGRYFDYSTFGEDSTYQAGLRWRPVEEMLFRASFGQGFRAPSIGELFGAPSRFDVTLTDPCNDIRGLRGGEFGRGVGNPAPANVIANCVADGVPTGGSYSQSSPQVSAFVGGNASLEPETSESWNLGWVWQPSFLRQQAWSDGVTVEINYADIKLDNAIQSKDAIAVVNLCAQTGDPVACAAVGRSSGGFITGITNPLTNVGGIDTRAIDYNITWTSPAWSVGQFSVRSATSNLLEYSERVAVGSAVVERSLEGVERGSPAQGFPEWRSTTTIDWDLASFGATLGARYMSSLVEINNGGTELDAITYWDAQVRWSPGMWQDKVMLAVGVNNLFDEETPGCFSCDVNNMDPNLYDVPGRFGYIRFAYKQ
ncbi:MAG: TonB-dependent receptor [Hyphomonadaceae bacterium]|nr:TonB-dependent receptor [Hyphomonadaceae bacterium]